MTFSRHNKKLMIFESVFFTISHFIMCYLPSPQIPAYRVKGEPCVIVVI